MNTPYRLGSLAIAGSFLLAATVSAAAQSATSDACATIASAKFNEWRQVRLEVQRAKTFTDGSVVNDDMIVTQSTAYKKDRGTWTSAGITLRERAVPSPNKILHDMRLGQCTQAGHDTVNGAPATVYTYSYLPDRAGFVAQGRLWVSDVSGLPLREEFQDPSPPANQKVAKAISATYTYNDDVEVPRGAEVANDLRLYNNASAVRNMQSGGSGVGGAEQ
jgi:hypothetical protein